MIFLVGGEPLKNTKEVESEWTRQNKAGDDGDSKTSGPRIMEWHTTCVTCVCVCVFMMGQDGRAFG